MHAILGFVSGALLTLLFFRIKVGSLKKLGALIIKRAEQEAIAKQEAIAQEENQAALQRKGLMDEVYREREDLKRQEGVLEERGREIEHARTKLDKETKLQQSLLSKLEAVSELTKEEARENLYREISSEMTYIAKQAKEEAEGRARRIVATAINRLAVPTTSESSVTTISLPSDDLKGRIIGREGRNIHAFEAATGVNVVIDDTPCAIVLSGFDPIRKHIAKTAMGELVLDGRIHPTRIEEAVARAKQTIDAQIVREGERAALHIGAHDLHPDLIRLLGSMNFRTSYGQNLLSHSLEVAHILGLMAAELGLDELLAKRIGLLHDIGKALSHEKLGSHAMVGHDLALKCGESDVVANGIGCHHGEMEPMTIEGSLCGAADAITAARPGARTEPVENYVKRLKKLEELALDFPGVEQAFALQAGRELRVIVKPDLVDDNAMGALARDLSLKVQASLTYPGRIKVCVMREQRAVEYAL